MTCWPRGGASGRLRPPRHGAGVVSGVGGRVGAEGVGGMACW